MTMHTIQTMRAGLKGRSSDDLIYQGFTIGSILLILTSLWVF